MSVFIYELKKIWNLKIIAAVAALCVVFYAISLSFNIEHYPNGHPQTEAVAYFTELTEKYGSTLEPEELEEFLQIRERLTGEAADSEYMIAALNDIAESYKDRPAHLRETTADAAPGLYSDRVEAMLNSDEYRGIFYGHTLENTLEYTKGLATIVVLATLILLSPLLTTDRMRKMRTLQYTTKTGRKMIGTQLAAILLSSVFLTSVLIFIFGAIYSVNDTQIFWNNYVSSFGSYTILSIPVTFGQYILVLAGMLYFVGLALSAIAFMLSRFCGNYIALAAGIIPAAVAGVILCFELVFAKPLSRFCFDTGIALFEPIVCAVLLVLGAVTAICVVLRENRADVA